MAEPITADRVYEIWRSVPKQDRARGHWAASPQALDEILAIKEVRRQGAAAAGLPDLLMGKPVQVDEDFDGLAFVVPEQPEAAEPIPTALASGDPAEAVTVAYVHQNDVTYSWHHSMVEMVGHDITNHGRIMAGGYIAMRCGSDGLVEARNKAVRHFLEDKPADWLFWIDCDMGFEPDTVDRLLEAADPAERPVVGGLCFSMRETDPDGMGGWRTAPTPTVFDWAKIPDPDGGEPQVGFAVRWDYPPNTLTQCSGTGSACLLIHRSVFEKVQDKYGPIWYDRVPNTSTGQLISEDLSFCLRLGALGIPLFIHTGVKTTHLKPSWVGEEDYWQKRAVSPPPVSVEEMAGKEGGRR